MSKSPSPNPQISPELLASIPLNWSGQDKWLQANAHQVWIELCDTYPIDTALSVRELAESLETTKYYANPSRYLRAVLLLVEAEYEANPQNWQMPVPFVRLTKGLIRIKL